MTGRLGGSTALRATGQFLRKNLWAWPIIAAVLLGGAGWFVHDSVENAMRRQRINALNTILDADVAALRVWMADQRAMAELIASDENLRTSTRELLALADSKPESGRELLQAEAQSAIRSRLEDRLKRYAYSGYFLVSPSGVVLAADQDPPVGSALDGYRKEFFGRVVNGSSDVSKPYRSTLLLANEKGELRANLPTMFAAAAVWDDAGQAIAALGLRIRPDDQFTRILQVAQSGETGETYAFDRDGLFLSESRFDDDLKQMGLLVDQPDSRSVLTLELRDPEVNMALGERPNVRRTDQPLTQMAAQAVQGQDGYNVDGYRDYRGVPVIGAWRWLEDYDFGVATEIDVAEVFRPVYILRRSFWSLIALLALSAAGIFLAMWFIARQQRALQKATLAARQLGQYSLEEKLGAGGMGTVYKARHAMLRRPTAVKLLDLDKVSAAAVARFEREVQLTSALTHPNTVAVFDYGRTPDGIFYYAMEYLEGSNLDDLVTRFGPLPEARVAYLLRQVCGSLAEAHAAGMVHRDIKPANIFLTARGGLFDFVKVLDFGLAKALEGAENVSLTSPNAVTGTPLYLSPEAVNAPDHVDARTDVYAIGAVAYFLLSGSPPFTGTTIMEICMKHAQAVPEPPSARLGKPLTASLEALVLRCLAKSPSDRPKDASALLVELDGCQVVGRWTPDDASAWWSKEGAAASSQQAAPATATPHAATPTSPAAEGLTVAFGGPPRQPGA